MARIIVIGSGVIGLSAALTLQEAGYSVRILTRDRPQATTSMAAGALWSATAFAGQLRRWAQVSLNRFLPLTKVPGSGVTLQRFREVYAEPIPMPWYHDLIPFCESIPSPELPAGMRGGYRFDVPVVAPPIYLEYLQAKFESAGGHIETRRLRSLGEVADQAPLLVNCSGVGARELAGDEAVYPIRGQTMLVDAPQIQEGFMYNDEVVHIFPRADGVLIGGIKRAHDWDLTIDPAIAAAFLERCAQYRASAHPADRPAPIQRLAPGPARGAPGSGTADAGLRRDSQLRSRRHRLYLVLGLRRGCAGAGAGVA